MLHSTLNDALIAGDVDLEFWPIGCNIGYNQTARIVQDGIFVSVCRDSNGMYETAISYSSQCGDMQMVVDGI